MSETLLSVGLDVGTTSTQLILSRLTVENRAGSFSVPEMQITGRQLLQVSPVHFTPLTNDSLVDGQGVRQLLEDFYRQANIRPEQVDTGAVIVTGETSRKENAKEVLDALSAFAGDFVVATAGPALESILAAKGSGAVEYSRKTGKTLLHIDIGGGTSNLARIEKGRITATGCLNVGGRLLKFRGDGTVTYVSPVLRGLTDLQPGDYPAEGQVEAITQILVYALEMAAGLRPATDLLERLWTKECGPVWEIQKADMISFSGGVADCIDTLQPPGAFGDIGGQLGQGIKRSLLCRDAYRLGEQTIRATVIGAGCHSAQLSGSTVFYRNISLPLKNLPVILLDRQQQDSDALPVLINEGFSRQDTDTAVLMLPGFRRADYGRLSRLAQKIAEGVGDRPVIVCLAEDMAKALGQKLSLLLPPEHPCLCIDRVLLDEQTYLDVGCPVGPALPVVVKTLVLQQNQ